MVNTRLSIVFASLLACASPGCAGLFGPSKVADGQRYESGDSRYDGYFNAVYQQQVSAKSWSDDKQASRKPLADALSMKPSADADALVRATRGRASKAGEGATSSVFATALEQTARAERERARKLKAAADKLEELVKRGEELKKEADENFENRGADKADPKKTEKARTVRHELSEAVDVTRSLARDAHRGAKDVDDFLDDLGRVLDPPLRDRVTKKFSDRPDEAKKPEEAKKPAKPSESVSRPARSTASPTKPAERPAEKPPDEVFNP